MTTLESQERILMTADAVGGVWTYAVELCREYEPRGIHVDLATMGARLSPSQRLQVSNLANVTIHESGYRLEWMADPWDDVARAGEWLLDLARSRRPGVIHLNSYALGALDWPAPVLIVAHSCVVSWWWAVHGRPPPDEWDPYRERVARGLRRAQLIAAPSLAMAREVVRHYGVSSCETIPNGLDSSCWTPAAKRPVVLAAGRLWDEAKNIALLRDVKLDAPWRIRVAGDARHPNGHDFESGSLELLGSLSESEMRREYAAASIYVLPALYEPFGLTALEAALSGCALVLGDIPSLREIWGDAAFYVCGRSSEDLRVMVRLLTEDPDLRSAMSRRARHRALNYPIHQTADRYIGAYRSLAHSLEAIA